MVRGEATDQVVDRFVYRCEPGDEVAFLEHLQATEPAAPQALERRADGGFAAQFGQPSPSLALFIGAAALSGAIELLAAVLVASGAWDLVCLAVFMPIPTLIFGIAAWGQWRDQWRNIEITERGLVVRSARMQALGLEGELARIAWTERQTAVLSESFVRGNPVWHLGFEKPDEPPSWVLTTDLGETPAPLFWLAREVRAWMAMEPTDG